MPQSSVALRQKADALRLLRNPNARVQPSTGRAPVRPVWAKTPFACRHGACLALEVRADGLWVLARDAQGEAWAKAGRLLTSEQARAWAKEGFG